MKGAELVDTCTACYSSVFGSTRKNVAKDKTTSDELLFSWNERA